MMDKKILLVLFSAVIITGCVSAPSETANTGEKYRTGNLGLVVTFVPGVPPAKVFADSEVSAIFEVKNKGAADVEGAILYLTGYDKRYLFGSDQQQQTFAIPGKSTYNPNGEMVELIQFDTQVTSLPEDIDKFQQTFKATLCYSYETVASPSICINPAIHTAEITESVCSVKPVTLSGGQGAPVAVEKVEEELIGEQILFKIYISNNGGGIPFIEDLANCHTDLLYNEIDLVNLDSVSFSDYEMTSDCKPNPIRLVGNKGYAVCSLRSSDRFGTSSYVTPLNIRLSYNYRQSIKKDFEIVNI
jgi:hypothetical protein